jgi:septation ring formation regulator EzrA
MELKPVETRYLPVKLTDEELLAKGNELARKLHEVTVEEEAQKQAKSAMKSRLEGLTNELHAIGSVVHTKTETRKVEVFARHDAERHVVETVRSDTGEVVETRLMTMEERNLKLFPAPAPAEAPPAPEA